jgi:hypothetical protein
MAKKRIRKVTKKHTCTFPCEICASSEPDYFKKHHDVWEAFNKAARAAAPSPLIASTITRAANAPTPDAVKRAEEAKIRREADSKKGKRADR